MYSAAMTDEAGPTDPVTLSGLSSALADTVEEFTKNGSKDG